MQNTLPAAMRTDGARVQRVPWAAVLCAAVFVLTGWSQSAIASCGSYVVVVNPSAEYLRNRPIEHAMPEPSCPCQGPQCRQSDSTPAMPVSVQAAPEYGLEIFGDGAQAAIPQVGISIIDDVVMHSEGYLLIPDPPPRTFC